MQLLEIGLDHARADVTVRERLAVSSIDLPAVLADLQQLAADAVVLSTCNRVELYLLVPDADAGARQVVSYLARRSGLDEQAVRAATRERRGIEAVRHLCRVATAMRDVPQEASRARKRGLLLAYDDVLAKAALALDVPQAMAELPLGMDRDLERMRVETDLRDAGLQFGPRKRLDTP